MRVVDKEKPNVKETTKYKIKIKIYITSDPYACSNVTEHNSRRSRRFYPTFATLITPVHVNVDPD